MLQKNPGTNSILLFDTYHLYVIQPQVGKIGTTCFVGCQTLCGYRQKRRLLSLSSLHLVVMDVVAIQPCRLPKN